VKKLLGVLILSFAASGSVHAQGFIEFGIGQSRFDLEVPNAAVDDNDTGYAISGGYMFHPSIGVEVGYRKLGKTAATRTVFTTEVKTTAEVDGFMLGAVGRIAVAQQLAIVPRVGLYRWDGSAIGTVNGTTVRSIDDDGTDLYFGVGAEYSFTRQIFAGVHWARFDIDGDDVNVIELKVGLRF
jgi:OOP family OmpA-OmpF porin